VIDPSRRYPSRRGRCQRSRHRPCRRQPPKPLPRLRRRPATAITGLVGEESGLASPPPPPPAAGAACRCRPVRQQRRGRDTRSALPLFTVDTVAARAAGAWSPFCRRRRRSTAARPVERNRAPPPSPRPRPSRSLHPGRRRSPSLTVQCVVSRLRLVRESAVASGLP
jgi:hypothetical protein